MTMHFVPLQAEHLPLLHTWLARPHAAQWWQPTPSVDELHANYTRAAAGGKTRLTPAPHNLRAIHCYRTAGFSDVGEVMTPDGLAWLMRWRRAS